MNKFFKSSPLPLDSRLLPNAQFKLAFPPRSSTIHTNGMRVPTTKFNPASAPGAQVAVLAGGCFWGVQGVFQHVRGVFRVLVGYAGGKAIEADYESVSSGLTGHAEAVEITFDPDEIHYGGLLQIFFSVAHDPTQLDRQGPDYGQHYRSAIFPQSAEQVHIARAYIDRLNAARLHPSAIVARIEPGQRFYPAEHYHQDYMARHPHQPYVACHDRPKVEQLKRLFPERFRAEPQLVTPLAAH